jgi:hypothetical protein
MREQDDACLGSNKKQHPPSYVSNGGVWVELSLVEHGQQGVHAMLLQPRHGAAVAAAAGLQGKGRVPHHEGEHGEHHAGVTCMRDHHDVTLHCIALRCFASLKNSNGCKTTAYGRQT